MSGEKIWYEDITGIFTNENFYHILPAQTMTIEEKLNAIVRFFVYLGVLLALIRQDYRYLFFGIVAALVSVLLYEHEKTAKVKAEKFLEKNQMDIVDNKVCARSTIENPFMNPTIADITYNPNRPSACHVDNERVQDVVEQNFEARLFQDVGDIYGKQASQRQFYTMPSTTIPNDQDAFAKWCYGSGPSCKEGNGDQCYDNLMDDVQRRPGQNSAQ